MNRAATRLTTCASSAGGKQKRQEGQKGQKFLFLPLLLFLLFLLFLLPSSPTLRTDAAELRQMERLGRGVVVVNQGDGKVFVGWRLLGNDPDAIAFNVYRVVESGKPVKLNDKPITEATSFVDAKTDLTKSNSYFVRPVLNGREQQASASFKLPANAPARQYLSIPLQTPPGYSPNDASVGDVDGDGKDEIVYGACVIDDNGRGLYSTGLGHGDAMHFSDLDPTRPGLEVFNIQERFDNAGANFRDARTGEILWKKPSIKAGADGEGPGRGLALDIDPRHKGFECWVRGAQITGLFNARGEKISEATPRSCNFGVWWDGDPLRELLDRNVISKWNWMDGSETTLLTAEGCTSNNGTKATPTLSADILGDWREEVIWRTTDNKELRIYTTTIPTKHRFYTLMRDPQYRLSVAWQNVAYNQPPHTGFYLGERMAKPPRPAITMATKR
jgi:hypothetical protein